MKKKNFIGGAAALVLAAVVSAGLTLRTHADLPQVQLAGCGTNPVLAERSNASRGTVTVGSGLAVTSCSILFNATYGEPPACAVSISSSSPLRVTSTQTITEPPVQSQLLVRSDGLTMANQTIMYICQ